MFDIHFDLTGVNKLCDKLKKELKSVKGSRAGYIGNQSYPNGLKVSDNALIQEYGATINVTPKMRAWFRHQGFPLSKNTTTIRIPPRPFMRMALKDQKQWAKYVEENFDTNQDGTMTLMQIAKTVAEMIKTSMQDAIDSNIEPTNSGMTVKKKKSSHSLIDTGLLRGSIQTEVIKE